MKSLLKAPCGGRNRGYAGLEDEPEFSQQDALSARPALLTMAYPAIASNLTYNFSGASAGNFGKSTSVEPVTTIGADSVNRDISKNSAFIPPEFGSPQADILGTGELLTPDISGVEPMFPHSTQANFGQTVTSNGAMSGGGDIVMPPDAENTTVSSAPIYEISTGTGAVSATDSLGGYTGGGADAAYGSGYTSTSGMKYSDGSIGKLSIPSIGVNKKVYDGETIANTDVSQHCQKHGPHSMRCTGRFVIVDHARNNTVKNIVYFISRSTHKAQCLRALSTKHINIRPVQGTTGRAVGRRCGMTQRFAGVFLCRRLAENSHQSFKNISVVRCISSPSDY